MTQHKCKYAGNGNDDSSTTVLCATLLRPLVSGCYSPTSSYALLLPSSALSSVCALLSLVPLRYPPVTFVGPVSAWSMTAPLFNEVGFLRPPFRRRHLPSVR